MSLQLQLSLKPVRGVRLHARMLACLPNQARRAFFTVLTLDTLNLVHWLRNLRGPRPARPHSLPPQ